MRLLINNIKVPVEHSEKNIIRECSKKLHIDSGNIGELVIKHKSLDARNKSELKYIYTVEADIKNGERFLKSSKYKNVSPVNSKEYILPEASYSGRPVIVGAGPAGLFCAYTFVEAGICPIILERGFSVDIRKKDVEEFWKNGILRPNSNVSFGEGGAGTFSDGKLNTVVKDRNGRYSFVMNTLVKFGAPANILYDSKPHVGTDILINVVKNMREYLCENGAEIFFNTTVTDIGIKNTRVVSVIATKDEQEIEIETDRVVLAIGHSARDTFEWLDKKNISMEPKSFAVGFRVEHPSEFIDVSQYGIKRNKYLPAATYKLTAHTSNGRGVYSFCMCPGGYVVNASTESEHLAINGMSYSGRDGRNSNSAIIITVSPEDYPQTGNLSGVDFQRNLEYKAYEIGKSKIPVQSFGDFKTEICGKTDNKQYNIYDELWDGFIPQNMGGFVETDLSDVLPRDLSMSLIEGMESFGRSIKGFDDSRTYLSAVESRTSSPVRIWRNDNCESPSITGLYPCGEGAGYAGGITSAAIDGVLVAENILKS